MICLAEFLSERVNRLAKFSLGNGADSAHTHGEKAVSGISAWCCFRSLSDRYIVVCAIVRAILREVCDKLAARQDVQGQGGSARASGRACFFQR
jgi:hypothetical protein